MDAAELRASTTAAAAPDGLAPCVRALWHAARGEWDRAHEIAQGEDGSDGAWVHAHLHRIEGDLGNAGYWYRRAGKPAATGGLDAEWDAIAAALLAAG
ncbi:MAG: hypothetical protein R3F55_25210 [Alphaproteobacteria bacterium]